MKNLRPNPLKPTWSEHEDVHQYEINGGTKFAHVFAATLENQGKFFYRACANSKTIEGNAPTLERAKGIVELFIEHQGGKI